MLSLPHGRPRGARSGEFILYVEGPTDRDVLCAWVRRISPPLARVLAPNIVILGGRRPARALEHFRAAGANGGRRGLCVLDRDGLAPDHPVDRGTPGLEFFTWPRRHIESYLLVPRAILRSVRLEALDTRLRRYFRDFLPEPGDELAWQALEGKRLLSPRGDLARLVGRPIPAGPVARAMRREELHPDVVGLVERLRGALGVREPETAIRRS